MGSSVLIFEKDKFNITYYKGTYLEEPNLEEPKDDGVYSTEYGSSGSGVLKIYLKDLIRYIENEYHPLTVEKAIKLAEEQVKNIYIESLFIIRDVQLFDDTTWCQDLESYFLKEYSSIEESYFS